MIIQFNHLRNVYDRMHGAKMFYHCNDGTIPSNQQVADLLRKRYLNEYVVEENDQGGLSVYVVWGASRELVHEAFPIFCTYTPDGRFSGRYAKFNIVPWDTNGWYDHRSDDYI